ncbi:hypothetical protein MRB53_010543 [Persea americana]|uniref:Uncharacterized protein n=1 Tax=Persea americana TaxID=3435 RepID=A0ACC2LTA3_PERAE|nr:hypothetical protein MRB53_010543 [Persea americana]
MGPKYNSEKIRREEGDGTAGASGVQRCWMEEEDAVFGFLFGLEDMGGELRLAEEEMKMGCLCGLFG